MSATSSKRAVIASSPLEDGGILRQMFSYVGFGHWLYLVPVCKRWLAEYRALAEELISHDPYTHSHGLWCHEHAADCATVTFWRAGFSSAKCLEVAVAGGLRLLAPAGASSKENSKFERLLKQLGRFGSRDLLLHARQQYSMPWTDWLCAGAAESGDLSKLQWLHIDQQCPWYVGPRQTGASTRRVTVCAAISDNGLAMLRWLKEEGVETSSRDLANYAAACGRLHTLQFLAPEGRTFAEEFPTLCVNAALNGHLEVLQWLHEHGASLCSNLGDSAAIAGSVPVLAWLAEVLPPDEHWSTQQLTAMLQAAGCQGSLEACILAEAARRRVAWQVRRLLPIRKAYCVEAVCVRLG
jgi:hypothetical protein